jgi:hypothetical protein
LPINFTTRLKGGEIAQLSFHKTKMMNSEISASSAGWSAEHGELPM